MHSYSNKISNSLYYRLIALWVVCEAMLGGIIHGLKIPVSGLLVGSCAVVCISLIAWFVPSRFAILKATIIVAIFKMILSPQAPFPAYIAVFFQGALGQLLFFNKKYFRAACIIFGVLALLESGLQRILVLTIVYGKDLWTVINDFINGLTNQKQEFNYSLLLAGSYTAVHFLTGLIVGNWAGKIPLRINRWQADTINIFGHGTVVPKPRPKKRFFKRLWFIIYVILIGLYIQSLIQPAKSILPASLPLKILIRSSIIIISWVFIAGPFLKYLLHRWLAKKQSRVKEDIAAIADMLPSMQSAISIAWKNSTASSGLKRISFFARSVLANTIKEEAQVYILSAPVGSGKTSALLNWASQRNDVYGILSPVMDGQRKFLDLSSREFFDMEAKEDEKNVIRVGKFIFSGTGFEKAMQVIHSGIDKNGWLVIDEIGPLELRGEGFHEVLSEIMNRREGKIILVIREQLLMQVVEFFQIKSYVIITDLPQ